MSFDYKKVQRIIDYEFDNLDLLQQAFVRKSYSEENGGQNNEVLEFIGDKALDLAVIRLMMDHFGEITTNKEYDEFKLRNPKCFQTKLDEGKFTDIKKDLVEKKSLSKAMDKLGFHKYLIMGEGDIKNKINEKDSVKEDLFEAIIGAVSLDSDWDLNEITNVVEHMLDFDAYFNNEDLEDDNYVSKMQEWSLKNGYGLPIYNYFYDKYNKHYETYITIQGTAIERVGIGQSKKEARMKAAYNCYSELDLCKSKNDQMKEIIGSFQPGEAMAKLNELVQKNYISEPVFIFQQYFLENGDPDWECIMKIADYKKTYKYSSSSKKDAKRECAFEFLWDILEDKLI